MDMTSIVRDTVNCGVISILLSFTKYNLIYDIITIEYGNVYERFVVYQNAFPSLPGLLEYSVQQV
jgi:hypothetical protein